MEIEPIAGVRAVTPTSRLRRESRKLAEMVSDPGARVDDEACAAFEEEQSRALDHDSAEGEGNSAEAESEEVETQSASRVNLFA
jgi:hypothetical protein